MHRKKRLFIIMLSVLVASASLYFVLAVQARSLKSIVAETHTVCASGCDFSSIQAAINAATSGDTLSLAGETFTGSFSVDNKSLTIQGAGPTNTILQAASTPGTASDRVVTIYATAKVTLSGVTVRYGVAPDPGSTSASLGGGIYNVGTLTITQSIVTENQAEYGGGIFNNTPPEYPDAKGLFIIDSTISNNQVSGRGGGIYNFVGSALVQNTIIQDNDANYGGGLYNRSEIGVGRSFLTVGNSTIAGNSAYFEGAGIYQNALSRTNLDNSTVESNEGFGGIFSYASRITVTNSTIYSNTFGVYSRGGYTTISNTTITRNNGFGFSNKYGYANVTNSTVTGNSSIKYVDGGISNEGPFTVTLQNTLIADHQQTDGDCVDDGPIEDLGYNLVEDGSCLTAATSFAADPKLGPLQDNGGDNYTQALMEGSPAIDAIPTESCAVTHDQRGVSRPQGEGCDIGAFEASDPLLSITITGSGSGIVTSEPPGVSCSSDCSQVLDFGEAYILTATAGVNSVFSGWGEACSGTGSCVMTMTEPVLVSANFDLDATTPPTTSLELYLPLLER